MAREEATRQEASDRETETERKKERKTKETASANIYSVCARFRSKRQANMECLSRLNLVVVSEGAASPLRLTEPQPDGKTPGRDSPTGSDPSPRTLLPSTDRSSSRKPILSFSVDAIMAKDSDRSTEDPTTARDRTLFNSRLSPDCRTGGARLGFSVEGILTNNVDHPTTNTSSSTSASSLVTSAHHMSSSGFRTLPSTPQQPEVNEDHLQEYDESCSENEDSFPSSSPTPDFGGSVASKVPAGHPFLSAAAAADAAVKWPTGIAYPWLGPGQFTHSPGEKSTHLLKLITIVPILSYLPKYLFTLVPIYTSSYLPNCLFIQVPIYPSTYLPKYT